MSKRPQPDQAQSGGDPAEFEDLEQEREAAARMRAVLARVRGLLKYPEVTKVMLVEALGEFGPPVKDPK